MNLQFTIERQFHTLTHFNKIDEKYLYYLLKNSNYSKTDILNQTKIYGSKFHFSFVKNPLELLTIIEGKISEQHLHLEFIKNKCELSISFAKDKFPEGIGNDTIVNINSLSENEKKNINKSFKNNIPIKTVKLKREILTWDLNIIIGNEQEPEIITFFPGKYAPPLPDKAWQTIKQYNEYVEFWDKYVFLL